MSGADFIRDIDVWHRRAADVVDSINCYSIGDSTGLLNAYTLTLRTPHTISRYLDGQRFSFIPSFTNNDVNPTANVNNVGAKVIYHADGASGLRAGAIVQTIATTIEYDSSGDRFRLVSSPGGATYHKHFVTTTGSANAYIVTTEQLPADNVTGQVVCIIASFTNTGASTIAVNGATAKNILKLASSSLEGNEILSGHPYELIYNGSDYLLLGLSTEGPAHYKDFTAATVQNTSSETTFGTFSIPANYLGTRRAIRYTLEGSLLNNTGSNNGMTLNFYYDDDLVMSDTVDVSVASNAGERRLFVQATLVANNSTSSQFFLYFRAGGNITTNAALTANANCSVGFGTASEDSSVAKNFLAKVQLSTNSNNLAFTKNLQIVEFL